MDETSVSDNEIAALSYAQANAELEAILRRLESNQLELEESLKAYERGVALLRSLKSRLNDAEQRVSVLLGEIEPESTDSVDQTLS